MSRWVSSLSYAVIVTFAKPQYSQTNESGGKWGQRDVPCVIVIKVLPLGKSLFMHL